jgi:hypothetical protein
MRTWVAATTLGALVQNSTDATLASLSTSGPRLPKAHGPPTQVGRNSSKASSTVSVHCIRIGCLAVQLVLATELWSSKWPSYDVGILYSSVTVDSKQVLLQICLIQVVGVGELIVGCWCW